MNSLTILSVFLLVVFISDVRPQDFRRNGEPLNINWIFSLPWDVSNTLRAPLGGPASIILTAGLALIMLFGMAVSPVFYLLGTPSRKYRPHDAIMNRLEGLERSQGDFKGTDQFLPNNVTLDKIQGDNSTSNDQNLYPDFTQSLFWLIKEEDVHCQKLMTCHAHGFFNFLPESFFTFYRYFSRKMVSIPPEFQEAILIGLEDQSLCVQRFSNCSESLVTIIKNTFSHIVPTDLSPLSGYVEKVQDWLEQE